jgi:hypothetical protein
MPYIVSLYLHRILHRPRGGRPLLSAGDRGCRRACDAHALRSNSTQASLYSFGAHATRIMHHKLIIINSCVARGAATRELVTLLIRRTRACILYQ